MGGFPELAHVKIGPSTFSVPGTPGEESDTPCMPGQTDDGAPAALGTQGTELLNASCAFNILQNTSRKALLGSTQQREQLKLLSFPSDGGTYASFLLGVQRLKLLLFSSVWFGCKSSPPSFKMIEQHRKAYHEKSKSSSGGFLKN